ncbi:hypothetical protein [Cognatilysobacter terrigena]|uniref:hypothetical protein n=1 Tax=Cognatilysobacter terrigena TaxID=2488749 RepID=UPI00105C4D8C|nr:hypothetical protein [Lysobacter terrigena]
MWKFIALVTTLGVVNASAAELTESELSIGGIEIGATEASVRNLLGEPVGNRETDEGEELYYPGLVVTVGWLEQRGPKIPRRVSALLGTGYKACTPSGLCPGMSIADATRLYGASKPVERENGTFLEYQPAAAQCWLQVPAKADPIYKVAVVCQP